MKLPSTLQIFLANTHVVADIDVQQEIEGSREVAYGLWLQPYLSWKKQLARSMVYSELPRLIPYKNHLWINFTNP